MRITCDGQVRTIGCNSAGGAQLAPHKRNDALEEALCPATADDKQGAGLGQAPWRQNDDTSISAKG